MTPNLENAIAISAEFHTHKDYGLFYELFGGRVNGFTGIYDLVAGMAKALTEFEAAYAGEFNGCPWDEMPTGRDWIEFIEDFVNEFITRSILSGDIARTADIIKTLEDNPKGSGQ